MEQNRSERSLEDSDYEKILKRQRMREGRERITREVQQQLVNEEGTVRNI
jgi:hypothetical protein